jgi:thiamine biosynthesis lipoprotein
VHPPCERDKGEIQNKKTEEAAGGNSMIEMSRRKFVKLIATLGAASSLPGLLGRTLVLKGRQLTEVRQSRALMGTLVTVVAVDSDPEEAERGIARSFAEIERLIKIFSRHDRESSLGRLNRFGILENPPRELVEVLQYCTRVYNVSEGAFDPTVLPLVEAYEKGMGDVKKILPSVGWDRVIVERDRIALKDGTRITLDGIAKGYIAHRAAEVLSLYVEEGAVNAGGDISTFGKKWVVGIEHPEGGLLSRVKVDGGVATSGSYRIYYSTDGKLYHIFLPSTGSSPQWYTSVSVIAKNAMKADAIATAAFALPPAKALAMAALEKAEILLMQRDGVLHHSRGWKEFAELY